MELAINLSPFFTATLYATTLASYGWIALWPQKSEHWAGGFVVRLLWLGFVIRWWKKEKPAVRQLSDIFPFDEEPH